MIAYKSGCNMLLGLILVIFLLGGFSGRFGGYGYGNGGIAPRATTNGS